MIGLRRVSKCVTLWAALAASLFARRASGDCTAPYTLALRSPGYGNAVVLSPKLLLLKYHWDANSDPSSELPLLQGLASSIGGSKALNAVGQYPNGYSQFPGNGSDMYLGTDAIAGTPPTTLPSNATIATEVKAYFNSHPQYDAWNTVSVILLPQQTPGITQTCGWHDSGAAAYPPPSDVGLPFAVIPYFGKTKEGGTCYSNNNALDNLSAITVHEIAEAITNPFPNVTGRVGWTDNNGNEIADCCKNGAFDYGFSGYAYDTYTRSGLSNTSWYATPALWSNSADLGSGGLGGYCAYTFATRMDVFQNRNGHLWHSPYFTGSAWNNWTDWGVPGFPMGALNTSPGAVSNRFPRFDVWIGATNDTAHMISYDGANNAGWNSWGIPSSYFHAPFAASNRPEHYDLFESVVGWGGNIYRRTYNNGNYDAAWSPLPNLPSGIMVMSQAAVVEYQDADPPQAGGWQTRFDLFFRGSDGNLWHGYGTLNGDNSVTMGGWNVWSTPSGYTIASDGQPAATSWGSGRIDVIIPATTGDMIHWYWDQAANSGNGAFGANVWPQQGAALSNPTLTSLGTHRLAAFARDSSGNLWAWQWSNQLIGNGWYSLGVGANTNAVGGPSASSM